MSNYRNQQELTEDMAYLYGCYQYKLGRTLDYNDRIEIAKKMDAISLLCNWGGESEQTKIEEEFRNILKCLR